MKLGERVAKGGLPYAESSWHAGEKVRQINDVSAITYSKIHRDDKKEERERKFRITEGQGLRTERIKGQHSG